MKALYGMSDEMDTTDFFKQTKEQTNIVFVKEDDQPIQVVDDDESNCAKLL